ncbi:hypothetical protein [Microbulbifer sp. HZ11]|uniref:hypothetical protein n=1 Tax=unclassified Microbulbifer TaxID=2619833 RepID=UPI000AAD3547|nr:hypothetical protein [Microbulbifer sp. HZ11]
MQSISWFFHRLPSLHMDRVSTWLLLLSMLSMPSHLQAQSALSSTSGEYTPPQTEATEALQPIVEKIQLHKQRNGPFEFAGVKGTLSGGNTIEYLIEAKTGQSLELDLRSDHAQASYRITAPAAPRALHRGQGRHSMYSVTLPRDGTYRVLVYLMDAAAKNGERAEFFLNIRIRNPG